MRFPAINCVFRGDILMSVTLVLTGLEIVGVNGDFNILTFFIYLSLAGIDPEDLYYKKSITSENEKSTKHHRFPF